MSPKLILQLHVHSERSHDSDVSIGEYVNYLKNTLAENEYAVLGITDHNVLPIKIQDALKYSDEKVIVIPGIQWKLKKTLLEAIGKMCTRREILTLGNHDNFLEFIEKKGYSILKNKELSGNLSEEEFFEYLDESDNLAVIIPHPRHLFFDYYGKREIEKIHAKITKRKNRHKFFVENQTGYDPFPRIFSNYQKKYSAVGGSDAHRIHSFFKISALFSVETSIICNEEIIREWRNVLQNRDLILYEKFLRNIFFLLEDKNDFVQIKKYYLRSAFHFLYSIPAFLKRRLSNFPKNLTR